MTFRFMNISVCNLMEKKINYKQLDSVNFRNLTVHITKQEKILPNSHR